MIRYPSRRRDSSRADRRKEETRTVGSRTVPNEERISSSFSSSSSSFFLFFPFFHFNRRINKARRAVKKTIIGAGSRQSRPGIRYWTDST